MEAVKKAENEAPPSAQRAAEEKQDESLAFIPSKTLEFIEKEKLLMEEKMKNSHGNRMPPEVAQYMAKKGEIRGEKAAAAEKAVQEELSKGQFVNDEMIIHPDKKEDWKNNELIQKDREAVAEMLETRDDEEEYEEERKEDEKPVVYNPRQEDSNTDYNKERKGGESVHERPINYEASKESKGGAKEVSKARIQNVDKSKGHESQKDDNNETKGEAAAAVVTTKENPAAVKEDTKEGDQTVEKHEKRESQNDSNKDKASAVAPTISKEKSNDSGKEKHEQVKENKNFTKKLPERKDAVEATFALYRGAGEKEDGESKREVQSIKNSGENETKIGPSKESSNVESIKKTEKKEEKSGDLEEDGEKEGEKEIDLGEVLPEVAKFIDQHKNTIGKTVMPSENDEKDDEKKSNDSGEEEEKHEQVKENKNFTKKLPERKDAVEATFALYRGAGEKEDDENISKSDSDSEKSTTSTGSQTEKVEFAKNDNDPMADFKRRVEEKKNEKLRKQVASDVEKYRREHGKSSDDEDKEEIEPSEKAKEIKSGSDKTRPKEGVDKKFEQKEQSASENLGKTATSHVAVSGRKQPEGKDVK